MQCGPGAIPPTSHTNIYVLREYNVYEPSLALKAEEEHGKINQQSDQKGCSNIYQMQIF